MNTGVERLTRGALKMTDQIAGHENAGYENAGHEIARHDKELTAFCSILVFFLHCDADVAAVEMCNVIMK